MLKLYEYIGYFEFALPISCFLFSMRSLRPSWISSSTPLNSVYFVWLPCIPVFSFPCVLCVHRGFLEVPPAILCILFGCPVFLLLLPVSFPHAIPSSFCQFLRFYLPFLLLRVLIHFVNLVVLSVQPHA